MSKTIRASALILLLACSARAGYIPNGSPAPPAPTPTPQAVAQEPAEGGVIDTPLTAEEMTAEAVLSVITSVLALI